VKLIIENQAGWRMYETEDVQLIAQLLSVIDNQRRKRDVALWPSIEEYIREKERRARE
jgi:hypothetical protein